MPFSKDLDLYPDDLYKVMNHAYLRGVVEIPCLDRSPHTVRLYLYSFRRAIKAAIEEGSAVGIRAAALQEALTRFNQLIITLDLEAAPPIVRLHRRDTTALGEMMEVVAKDLAREEARIRAGQGLGGSSREPTELEIMDAGEEGKISLERYAPGASLEDDKMSELVRKLFKEDGR